MSECTDGPLIQGMSYEYHSGNCPLFVEARTQIRLGRIETSKDAIVTRLAAGETVESLAAELRQPTRVLERFAQKYQREIDAAKEPKPAAGAGGR
jgi:hypothetical protein